jgi:flagellar basal-body rod modification protein FlgD
MSDIPINTANTNAAPGGLAAAMSSKATEQRTDFLELLTMQLRNQNPLKPFDNQEFASQLAQFSQLEELSGIKELIGEQNKFNSILSQTMSNTALPGMLGKSAKAMTENLNLEKDTVTRLGYIISEDVSGGQIEILNSSGVVVKTIEIKSSDVKYGQNVIEWDGRDDNGNQLEEGNYTFFADFDGPNGGVVNSKTFTEGTIESVRFKNTGTVLLIGGQEIALNDILDIRL